MDLLNLVYSSSCFSYPQIKLGTWFRSQLYTDILLYKIETRLRILKSNLSFLGISIGNIFFNFLEQCSILDNLENFIIWDNSTIQFSGTLWKIQFYGTQIDSILMEHFEGFNSLEHNKELNSLKNCRVQILWNTI